MMNDEAGPTLTGRSYFCCYSAWLAVNLFSMVYWIIVIDNYYYCSYFYLC